MLIDTRTKESMIASLASYLDITEDELFQYIDYAANKAQPDSWTFNTDMLERSDEKAMQAISKILIIVKEHS